MASKHVWANQCKTHGLDGLRTARMRTGSSGRLWPARSGPSMECRHVGRVARLCCALVDADGSRTAYGSDKLITVAYRIILIIKKINCLNTINTPVLSEKLLPKAIAGRHFLCLL